MHIYTYIMSAHIHTYTYIHTHTKCTYERTQSTSETTARQRLRGQPNLTPRSSALLLVRITIARHPDHIPLICTGSEPIHPVHCPRQLPAWPCRPMAPRNEVIFVSFWRGFNMWNSDKYRSFLSKLFYDSSLFLWVMVFVEISSAMTHRSFKIPTT